MLIFILFAVAEVETLGNCSHAAHLIGRITCFGDFSQSHVAVAELNDEPEVPDCYLLAGQVNLHQPLGQQLPRAGLSPVALCCLRQLRAKPAL